MGFKRHLGRLDNILLNLFHSHFVSDKEGEYERGAAAPVPERAAAQGPRGRADQAQETPRGRAQGRRFPRGAAPLHRHQEDDRGGELAERGHYSDGQGVCDQAVHAGLCQASQRKAAGEEGDRSRAENS